VHRELEDGTTGWREGDAEVSAALIDAFLTGQLRTACCPNGTE
jgi:hypothetical protein